MIERIINRFKYNVLFNSYKHVQKGSSFEINNWDLSNFVLKKVIPVAGTAPFPLNELLLMAGVVAWAKPSHIFEWGTHIGKSARVFSETCSFLKLDTVIHSIDLPDTIDHVEHPHNKRGKLVKGKRNVTLHQGDGVETALKIYGTLKNSNPVFYLDGDHSYESVLKELTLILENVSSPKILLHDTFYQTPESGYNIGPYQAISDTLATFSNIPFKRIDTNTGLPGMTFLYTL